MPFFFLCAKYGPKVRDFNGHSFSRHKGLTCFLPPGISLTPPPPPARIPRIPSVRGMWNFSGTTQSWRFLSRDLLRKAVKQNIIFTSLRMFRFWSRTFCVVSIVFGYSPSSQPISMHKKYYSLMWYIINKVNYFMFTQQVGLHDSSCLSKLSNMRPQRVCLSLCTYGQLSFSL